MNQMQIEQEEIVEVERPSFLKKIFGPPRLPKPLIWTAVLSIISISILILNSQRILYWFDFSLGYVGNSWLDKAIQINPALFFAVCMAYCILIYLLLRVLNFQIAIVIWSAVTYFHLRDIVLWTRCNVWKVLPLSEESCAEWGIGLSILFAGIVGLVLAASLRPSVDATAASRRSRILIPVTILATVWMLGLLAWFGWNLIVPVDGWIPIPVDNPPPARISTAIAYDSLRETAVMFGGGYDWQGAAWYDYTSLNDTWIWNGDDWEQKTSSTTPPGRFSHQMAYDPIRERIVMFGGQTNEHSLGDTWEWDGAEWHERHPVDSPPARCCHVMFFDTQRGKVVASSGLQTPDHFLSDIWEWDGDNWTQIINETPTPLMSGYPLAYNSDKAMGVVLAGSDTWIWQNGQWTFDHTAEISCRTDSSFAYDPVRGVYILYGGLDTATGCRNQDAWYFDGGSWTSMPLENSPGSLTRHIMFYDQKRRSVMLFGGDDANGIQNRLWELHWPKPDSE
ncbi:MAG: hypothetical protein DWQ04_27005 [Chloroflexi bacterium]|nr:MAG: hypothetical protein DWQ04_27005 [Chloroflexota bacterium]